MRIFLLLTSILYFTYGNAQNKIQPKKLNEDFDYLIKELKLQHQGLYAYNTKKETDTKIDSIRNVLNNSQTKLEFYKNLRYTIGLTNEGHTSIKLPKIKMIKLGLSKSFLPIAVLTCDTSLIVTQNYGEEVNGLKKGSKVISINNNKVSEILDKFYPLLPTDGFNETSKKEWIGGINFSLLYRLVYGKENKFELKIQEFGSNEIKAISISPVRYTKFKNKNAKFKSFFFDFDEFKFEQINDSIAYLSIPSFGDDDVNYEDFYKKNFKKIDSLNIKHLIIDIQANGGGTEGNENLLFSYLYEAVVKKYKQVTMLPKPYLKNKKDKEFIADKWQLYDTIAKRGDFTLYSDYYSDLGYKKPQAELVYKGKLYVLTSGVTFSGGAEFASLLKMTNRAVFIGEETGGAYEGNVSGYSEYVKLPNSKIIVDIPIVHYHINVTPEIVGRGIIPDYIVPQTWADYMNEKNSKKLFTIKMISE